MSIASYIIIYTHVMLRDKIFQGGPNISETYGPWSKYYGGPNISLQAALKLIKSSQKSQFFVEMALHACTVIVKCNYFSL